MNANDVSIIIVEPSMIVAEGLKMLLEKSPSNKIAAIFCDITQAQDHLPAIEVDIAIINPLLFSFNKRPSVRSCFPGIKIIALLYNYVERDIISMFDDSLDICDDVTKILKKIQSIALDNNTIHTLGESEELSEREKEILVSVAKGYINKEVASLYNLSVHTVISHRKNISRKTGIKSVSGFLVYALLNNLIEENDLISLAT